MKIISPQALNLPPLLAAAPARRQLFAVPVE